jgi:hypothetical protein
LNQYITDFLEKRGYHINAIAQDIILQADDWYRIKETQDHKRVTVNGMGYTLARMGFAKRAAADDANLCEVVEINTGDASTEYVNEILKANQWETQYRKQLELVSAEGTAACYVRVDNADIMSDGTLRGGDIRLNYINANGYLPLLSKMMKLLRRRSGVVRWCRLRNIPRSSFVLGMKTVCISMRPSCLMIRVLFPASPQSSLAM